MTGEHKVFSVMREVGEVVDHRWHGAQGHIWTAERWFGKVCVRAKLCRQWFQRARDGYQVSFDLTVTEESTPEDLLQASALVVRLNEQIKRIDFRHFDPTCS